MLPSFCQDDSFVWKKYRTPENAGWSSSKLENAKKYTSQLESAAVMVVVEGNVLLSWGNIEKKYKCHSIRKAFISAMYGPYVSAGVINLQKTLAEIGIDDIQPLTESEKKAKIVDLLMSRSGVYLPSAGEVWGMISRKPRRGSHPPGEFWYYNNWDFNALSTIFERETGRNLLEEIYGKIARPIGMEDLEAGDMVPSVEKEKSIHPNQRIRISTRDLARFGLLYEQEGMWNQKRILPSDWIRKSTSTLLKTGWGGYGYIWKTLPKEESLKYGFVNLGKFDAYYISGVSIHVLAVVPELNLVFVHRVDTDRGIPNYTHLPVFKLLDLIIAARTAEPDAHVSLVNLASEPLPPFRRRESQKPVRLPEAIATKISGAYDWNGELVTVEASRGHLHFYEGQDKMFMSELWPISKHRFFFTNSDHRLMEFIFGKDGDVISAHIIEEGVCLNLPRLK